MKATVVIGCLFVVTLMIMIPVRPAVEYQQIEETINIESNETVLSKLDLITSFIKAKKGYADSLEERIENIWSMDCDCFGNTDGKKPSIYIPILCEIFIAYVFFIMISLEILSYIFSVISVLFDIDQFCKLANDLLELEHQFLENMRPKYKIVCERWIP
jgi:hypothetical protein